MSNRQARRKKAPARQIAWSGSNPIPEQQRDRYAALLTLIRRTGARDYRIEHTNPANGRIAWVAIVAHERNGIPFWSAGGGMDAVQATYALADNLVTGGQCIACGRPAALEALDARLDEDYGNVVDVAASTLMTLCWYRFDPELKTYRRSCEGDT